jgi:hypothetical protein
MAAQQYNQNLAAQLTQLKLTQNTTMDVNAIYNTTLSGLNTAGRQPQQVGIQQSQEELRKKQGTLSGY